MTPNITVTEFLDLLCKVVRSNPTYSDTSKHWNAEDLGVFVSMASETIGATLNLYLMDGGDE